ncbi:MAG TPA: flagellar protein FliS, partial [Actinobacteria bacterium]|nr:flagellar protein FliS [Actinomycetota bacterium]
HLQLVKAQTIVTESSASLNMKEGGEIAQSLAALYDYCTDALLKANLTKSTVHLRPVEQIITELREAWNTMSGQNEA